MTDSDTKANAIGRDKKQLGQSMVEFALLLPLFLLVIFIVIDFGVGISRWVVVTSSTREGARIGAVGASTADIQNKVALTSNGLLDATDVTVTYFGNGDGSVDRGESVVVESDYDYTLITPLRAVLGLAGGTLTFHSCTDMRVELTVSGAVDSGVSTCD